MNKLKRKTKKAKKYKESLIYFAFKIARNFSYRDLEHQLKEIKLFEEVSNFSSLFYRFKHLNKLIIEYFIKKITNLIKQIEKLNTI